jgi:hypothetical protein
MTIVELRVFLAGVEERKRAVGMTEDAASIDSLRNKGVRRTNEKRMLLRRMANRVRRQAQALSTSRHGAEPTA